MPPDVAQALQSLQDARSARKDDYVFVTQYGLPDHDVPHERWKQAVQRAGVDYRRCYTLRHSFASQALSNNVRLSYVSAALGHASVNVTAQKCICLIVVLPQIRRAWQDQALKPSWASIKNWLRQDSNL